ncbi:hypothetical protein AMELA_G00043980 [Ameiurus melas]|uniref:Uncharacterized protein n=1 Tax=Ameiurus melas TaxID=219545 RepID=A0A7J6B6C0_AMEME|nr:hypothetical protein AMELA_G00043980 [Ameiurus melas]
MFSRKLHHPNFLNWDDATQGKKKNCKMATILPDATPPPLAMAAADIINDAMDPATMPPVVKPTAEIASGVNSTEQTSITHEKGVNGHIIFLTKTHNQISASIDVWTEKEVKSL